MVSVLQAAYNLSMARGWESKAVESQIEESNTETEKNPEADGKLSPEQLRRRANLRLSRAKAQHDMDASQSERHKQMLKKAIDDLDRQLAELS